MEGVDVEGEPWYTVLVQSKEGNTMNNNEATQIINERIDAMLNDTRIQAMLIEMRSNGYTDDQCKQHISKIAICSLVGN